MDSTLDNHSRTIVHIDIDCFYAQVEMNKNPELRSVPLGIKQKNIVVTSNYVARKYGVKKCMLISDAQKNCPNLRLVNGEDLHDYRHVSYQVTTMLQKYSNLVERLGLDENYIDISDLVSERLTTNNVYIEGNIFGDTTDTCDCGCYKRLSIGTIVAKEMRDQINSELNLTTCAGVGHNKLLAKIVCAKYKPNQQTVIFPNNAVKLMLSLNSISEIPGVGVTLREHLESLNVQTVADLQNVYLPNLSAILGLDKAKNIYDLSFGLDKTLVKSTGKPNSIGIEDSCKVISAEKEVKEKFHQLLRRLLILVSEDGRRPKTIKVTIRKYNKNNKFFNRESKQCNINSTIFKPINLSNANLSEANFDKIMTVIMRLFNKLIDVKKPYHLTLLGLSFTKFLETSNAASTLTKFFMKDLEVQSFTNIESFSENVLAKELPSTSYLENIANESESVSKRFKSLEIPLQENEYFRNYDNCESPSSLKVSELKLSATDFSSDNQGIMCPPNADENVFKELPQDVQQELWEEHKRTRERESNSTSQVKKSRTNTILNYFVKR